MPKPIVHESPEMGRLAVLIMQEAVVAYANSGCSQPSALLCLMAAGVEGLRTISDETRGPSAAWLRAAADAMLADGDPNLATAQLAMVDAARTFCETLQTMDARDEVKTS